MLNVFQDVIAKKYKHVAYPLLHETLSSLGLEESVEMLSITREEFIKMSEGAPLSSEELGSVFDMIDADKGGRGCF